MSFTARRISVEDGQDAMPSPLVYRRKDVGQLRDAATLVERARYRASSIVKMARKTAKMEVVRSAAVRRARERDADRAFISRVAALEEAYRLAQISLTAQLEATLDQVLAAALTRIGVELPAEERLRVVCDQLAKVAGPVGAARLRMCSADASHYRSANLRAEWPLQIDDALTAGDCRLTTDHGEWALAFDAIIESLSAVESLSAPNRDAMTYGASSDFAPINPAL